MPLGVELLIRGVFNRARRGLYGGRIIKAGNRISEDGGNKSRRTWKPNVHWHKMYSETLDRLIRLRVSTHALKCIDKAGGLDHYLLETPEKKLNSDIGNKLKAEILARQQHLQERQLQAAAQQQQPQLQTVSAPG